jgi:hypothetical protein
MNEIKHVHSPHGDPNGGSNHFGGLHGVEWVNLRGGGQFEVLFDGRK